MTIHDVRFMNRNTFYRLSLSEMFVPYVSWLSNANGATQSANGRPYRYGDPRNPIYRKGAFDLGNVGAGVTANNLQREYKA